ncbi:MAG: tRNA threonylcarbamoyladenosine dehydratase [Bacteroidales bacterium]|jgi:tRNA A37 threonylcarbamoyladenosine dehydratase|nr:tRNA threonylcarbamoyladenosine dehydratase [Bacteroidales bacterium]
MSTATNLDYSARTELLLGQDVLARLGEVRVLLFGAGGVGSWCAEGLVRSGVKHLTLVDADVIGVTNVNRQLMATPHTVGRVKVEALRDRLLEIAPDVQITALHKVFSAETAGEFEMEGYDYILDAIDSLKDKGELILRATRTPAVFFCSMGAACKVDPTQVRVAEFWNVRGCPLGAAIRKKFKQNHTWPGHKFRCVYDEEVLPNRGGVGEPESELFNKAQINGSLAHITAIFGMTLAGLLIQDVYQKTLAAHGDA